MASYNNSYLPDDHCEICAAKLSDEVVIQEFADGSIARLCAECAAGAALQPEGASFEELDAPAASDGLSPQAAVTDELDPMEKTRELLTPVVDLITLQREMQGALQRLAASLETFATDVISDNMDKTATVESRLEVLENELEQTRTRLRETEALLAAGGAAAATPQPAAAAATGAGLWVYDATGQSTAETTMPEIGEAAQRAADAEPAEAQPAGAAEPAITGDTGTQPYSAAEFAAQATPPPMAPLAAPVPVAPPAGPATAEHHTRSGFQLSEVQLAQRYFNESQFTTRVRDVSRSLGKPKANLTKVIGAEPRALLTVAWDIIWYQYLIDLRRDIASDQRVALHREGMDLGELTSIFRDKNASIDDEGRLDASELEVKLLSDPSTLITEMTVEDEKALEDATEEIWDQRTAPEFKWDD